MNQFESPKPSAIAPPTEAVELPSIQSSADLAGFKALMMPSAAPNIEELPKSPLAPATGVDPSRNLHDGPGSEQLNGITNDMVRFAVEQYGKDILLERTLIEGNPELGTIRVYQQVHCSAELSLKGDLTGKATPDIKVVMEYQYTIAKELQKDQPKIVNKCSQIVKLGNRKWIQC